MHDGGFMSNWHWGFGWGHWSMGILFWAAIIFVVVLAIKSFMNKK